jgi:hypothetical protein
VARSRGFRVPAGYAIQSAASPIDFDFWSWAMERFDGAAGGFRAPDFARLLDEVQRDD